MKGMFIVGTDTDVGKTFVSSVLIQSLMRAGIDPYYLKPIASGGRVDIDTLREYTGICEEKSNAPIIFETPCSPHLAAELEDFEEKEVEAFKNKIYKNCLSTIENNAFTLIEGAGGIIVPLHRNGYDLYHLIKELSLPVVLVTRTGVGTINHTMLTLAFLKNMNIEVAGLIFNGFENSVYERDNINLIKERAMLPVLGVIPKINEKIDKETIKYIGDEFLDISLIVDKIK